MLYLGGNNIGNKGAALAEALETKRNPTSNELLQSHSHASRSEVFVVGDTDDIEAVEFSVSSGRVDEKNAQDAVARMTGGRFALLNDYYVSAHHRGLTNDQVLASYHAATDSALVDVGIEPTDKLFREASTGLLGDATAKKLVGSDKLAQLTRENVLTVTPTYHSLDWCPSPSLRQDFVQAVVAVGYTG